MGACDGTAHNWVEALIIMLAVMPCPSLGGRRNNRRSIARDVQIGEPAKSQLLSHTPCDPLKAALSLDRVNGISKLFEQMFECLREAAAWIQPR